MGKPIQGGKKRMKAIVTGGAGFIGSHLVEELIKQKHEVLIADDLSTGKRSNINSNLNVKVIRCDISEDPKFWDKRIKDVDIIYHIASDSNIEKDNFISYQRNVLGTMNILDFMVQNKIYKIVFSSSATVYGTQIPEKIKENYPLLPICLYGASKVASEFLLLTCMEKFKIKPWIYRFANVVGGKMEHGVIHDFLQQLKEYGEIHMRGYGDQIRSFVYVDDIVSALVTSEVRPVGVYNITSDDTINVNDVAKIIWERWNRDEYKGCFLKNFERWQGDVDFSFPDNAKLKMTGWKPTFSSKRAVKKATEELYNNIFGN